MYDVFQCLWFYCFNLIVWIALARIKTFGVSYLYPLYPFHGRELLRFSFVNPNRIKQMHNPLFSVFGNNGRIEKNGREDYGSKELSTLYSNFKKN